MVDNANEITTKIIALSKCPGCVGKQPTLLLVKVRNQHLLIIPCISRVTNVIFVVARERAPIKSHIVRNVSKLDTCLLPVRVAFRREGGRIEQYPTVRTLRVRSLAPSHNKLQTVPTRVPE